MNEKIYLSPPDVGDAEVDAVVAAMRSGWVAPLGPAVDGFETALAQSQQRKHCVALSSGTAALHLALLGVGVRPGDVVITATMTFAATANAIVYTGADPVFVDCCADGNINPELVAAAVAEQQAAGRRVGAIVPVDLLGKVAQQEKLAQVALDAGVPLISDAAESLGATRDGKPSASFGFAAAVSFNGNKIMTTSGGGALLSDDEEFIARARYLATQARQPVIHYEHSDIGYNYRLSNVLAALGIAQLERLDSMISNRKKWRRAYRDFFANVDGVSIFADEAEGASDNCWLTAVIIDEAVTGWDRTQLMEVLASHDIESRPLWKPMHAQPVFADAQRCVDGTSEALFAAGLSLPSGSAMTDEQFGKVLEVLTSVIQGKAGHP